MAFRLLTNDQYAIPARYAASVAVSVGDALAPNGTGELIRATATSDQIVGVALQPKASTDSDYATVNETVVTAPHDKALFLADVGNGTVTEAIEMTYVDLHDADSLDVAASANDNFFVVKALTASNQCIGYFNSNAVYKNAVA